MTVFETLGQDAAERIRPAAAEQMIREIAGVGGREVFFAGAVDEHGLVRSVRVCARGTEAAVPAFIENLESGDVVLHNHPSGNIAPSEADLRLATTFGFHGHGVYIVDNAITRTYVVVEPFQKRAHQPLDPDELAPLFAPNGPIARTLPGYEARPQQTHMMEAVARAFNHDATSVIEAPTGVGKTMAYLIPAILWAVKNKERVVISTRTINLQEQLIHKDIPLLKKALDLSFEAVLVKGRGNYLCPRKLERALSEATLFDDEDDKASLESIAAWAEKTEDGSLSDLPFVPGRELWSRVCSEADTCSQAHCPSPRKCFVGKARRDVAKADVLVVNHHMLFSDLAIKKEIGDFSSLAVLPAYKRLILDEAHNVEDSATDYFGANVSRLGALALLGRFVRSDRHQERGLLPYLKTKLVREGSFFDRHAVDEILELIDNEALPALTAAREALLTAFSALRSLASEKCRGFGKELRWRLTEPVLKDPELREIHTVYVLPAVEEVDACVSAIVKLVQKLKKLPVPDEAEEPPFAAEMYQLDGYRERLANLGSVLTGMTKETLDPNTVRWMEIDTENEHVLRLARCPLEVGDDLAEWVYENLDTVVLTSATLTVNNSFHFFMKRAGVDRIQDHPVETQLLDSPFDFSEQAMLCIPRDHPLPDAPGFLDATVDAIRRAISVTRGHAFVLFTSYYALNHVHRCLERELRAQGITLLRQGSMNRNELLTRFREDSASVLLGTDSFWEGVDVAGEALQCVILPKLPFRVPTEPIVQARVEAIDAAGGNSFMDYSVPQAVIKFRQGFGRLIRRRDDRGVILVLDSRVVTKRYGQAFLGSLPGVKVVQGPQEAVFQAFARFFNQTNQ